MLSKTTIIAVSVLVVLMMARLYSLLPQLCEAPPSNPYEEFKCGLVKSILRRSS